MTVSATRRSPSNSIWSTVVGTIAVLCLFCAPLFVGLGNSDLASDEAIYSYAVDRILETGEWLTPRLIPYDGPFFEKPPLKFWALAGAMRAGLLPQSEFGLRFLDALFGAMAFVYVFWLGRRLAGSLCGVVAVLVLFTHSQLLFEHGLRSNNMDAALFLAYCGGAYHFARWVEDASGPWRAMHAFAVTAYLTFGFMTKFVAVLFLPLICAAALAWRSDSSARLRSGWRDWIVPALVASAVSAPWFVYQTLQTESTLWGTMFGQHVYARFTGFLDPRHLQPWHYYYSVTWRELTLAGSQWIAAAGMVTLVLKAWTGRPWLARLLLVWWVLPFALMSVGTSKVFHYAYPFLPPIALGAGAVASLLFSTVERGIRLTLSTAAGAFVRAVGPTWLQAFGRFQWPSNSPDTNYRLRAIGSRGLVAGAAIAIGMGLWTVLVRPIRWDVGGFELLSLSSIIGPLAFAAICLVLAGHARVLILSTAIVAVAMILPLSAYSTAMDRATSVRSPLQLLRNCVMDRQRQPTETHIYPVYEQLLDHSPYYYLRHVGPWIEHGGSPKNDELLTRLYAPGEQALLVLHLDDYERFVQQIARGEVLVPRRPRGLALPGGTVLLTPGPFETCAIASIAAGGNDVRGLWGSQDAAVTAR